MRSLLPPVVLALLVALAACRASEPEPEPEPEPPGEEIVVCGRRFPVGAPVVLWTDVGGYDATSTDYHFGSPRQSDAPRPGERRYQPGRKADGEVLVAPDSGDLAGLQQVVDQFVLHYDVCGVSSRCFRVLHDMRGLSVHFMIDIDGTIYQTMDLRDQAWHATRSNVRSIGVEIANMGSRRTDDADGLAELEEWYGRDTVGRRIRIPERLGDGGVRTRAFVGRPVRDTRVRGVAQGELREQYDFTREQYDSLVLLTAALCRAFPKIQPDAPRDATGLVSTHVLSDEEWEAFQGILGHHHVQANKQDPGPAFDWNRYLARVQLRLSLPD